MKIICHQFVKGHSKEGGFEAEMLKSRTHADLKAPYSLPEFEDTRRDSPTDKSAYVLEIEPTNDKYERTAAICAQWKTSGTPSKYTSWLIPTDGDATVTMRLLERGNFMTGEEMTQYYDSAKVLTVKEAEITDSFEFEKRTLTKEQEKNLIQFLGLYWTEMAKKVGSNGTHTNKILLVLRDEETNELMTPEKAAAFFNREIVSRLPREAQGMVSAVFGVEPGDAKKNFKKSSMRSAVDGSQSYCR